MSPTCELIAVEATQSKDREVEKRIPSEKKCGGRVHIRMSHATERHSMKSRCVAVCALRATVLFICRTAFSSCW